MLLRAVCDFVLLLIGGGCYFCLELCYRGHSHWSMFLLGGVCFVVLGHLPARLPMPVRAILGGAAITMLEFGAGLLLNRVLHLGVWDYSRMPGNLLGQICPQFFALWCALSVPAFLAHAYLSRWLFATPLPDFRWF